MLIFFMALTGLSLASHTSNEIFLFKYLVLWIEGLLGWILVES